MPTLACPSAFLLARTHARTHAYDMHMHVCAHIPCPLEVSSLLSLLLLPSPFPSPELTHLHMHTTRHDTTLGRLSGGGADARTSQPVAKGPQDSSAGWLLDMRPCAGT
mmetsp:Transcript_13393/g.34155  ORF Transcript_13393/g.34155 Transcript_13393/m.34155 type:complete len:108 (-) Transcript_13393:15-338(-)